MSRCCGSCGGNSCAFGAACDVPAARHIWSLLTSCGVTGKSMRCVSRSQQGGSQGQLKRSNRGGKSAHGQPFVHPLWSGFTPAKHSTLSVLAADDSNMQLSRLVHPSWSGPAPCMPNISESKLNSLLGAYHTKQSPFPNCSGPVARIPMLINLTSVVLSFTSCLQARLGLQKDGLPLYRHMLPPLVPGLAFVGCEASSYNTLLTSGLQAEWLAAVLVGQVAMPEQAAMQEDVQRMMT